MSELPNGSQDESQVSVNLVHGANTTPMHFDVVQPEGIKHGFSYWAAEVSRGAFLHDIGFAIIHSKVVVIDPFTNPVVITGSHNFSASASGKNDENFVIIRGNEKLAQAYAVNIISVYRHYRWRAYVSGTAKPWQGLGTDAAWQTKALNDDSRQEMAFWIPGTGNAVRGASRGLTTAGVRRGGLTRVRGVGGPAKRNKLGI